MEYCNGGTLKDFIDGAVKNSFSISEEVIWASMSDVSNALVHLHAQDVCHRDLSWNNILLHDGLLKITDFGLSNILQEGDAHSRTPGTPGFIAPEVGQGTPCTFSSDVYSLGCCIYAMMALRRYPGHMENLPGFSEDLTRLVASMLLQNPRDRPAPRQLVQQATQKINLAHQELVNSIRMDEEKLKIDTEAHRLLKLQVERMQTEVTIQAQVLQARRDELNRKRQHYYYLSED